LAPRGFFSVGTRWPIGGDVQSEGEYVGCYSDLCLISAGYPSGAARDREPGTVRTTRPTRHLVVSVTLYSPQAHTGLFPARRCCGGSGAPRGFHKIPKLVTWWFVTRAIRGYRGNSPNSPRSVRPNSRASSPAFSPAPPCRLGMERARAGATGASLLPQHLPEQCTPPLVPSKLLPPLSSSPTKTPKVVDGQGPCKRKVDMALIGSPAKRLSLSPYCTRPPGPTSLLSAPGPRSNSPRSPSIVTPGPEFKTPMRSHQGLPPIPSRPARPFARARRGSGDEGCKIKLGFSANGHVLRRQFGLIPVIPPSLQSPASR